jgi:UDP-glucose 4-epimerase
VYEEGRHHRLHFRVGDVTNYPAVVSVLRDVDVVFHAAALKQVPTAEYNPFEAARTNVIGAENVVRVLREHSFPIDKVVAVSTDKACKPVNVMGMTKAIQERIFAQANADCPGTRFLIARYGNVLASRGSVIPLFDKQIRNGGPVTVTTPEMTRFLMSLEKAVDTVFTAFREANGGETYVPRLPSARIVDVVEAMIGERGIEVEFTGIRPGEKVHEVLVSEEETPRTYRRGEYLAILPILPELRSADAPGEPFEAREYSSADELIGRQQVAALLHEHRMLPEHTPEFVQ